MSEPPMSGTKKPRKKKCSVKNCHSGGSKDLNLHYHQLPKPTSDGFINHENYFGKVEKVSKLKAWQMALGIGNIYTTNFLVCSRHFKRDDYLFPDAPANKRYLKRTAVPSLHLPSKEEKISARSSRLIKRQVKNSIDIAVKNQAANVTVGQTKHNKEKESSKVAVIKNQASNVAVIQNQASHVAVENTVHNEEEIDVTNYLDIVMESPDIVDNSSSNVTKGTAILKKDIKCSKNEASVQTEKFTVIHLIKTRSDLSTMTGLQSFKLLDTIVEILENCYSKSIFEINSLDTRSKVILTCMKLKQNMTYSALGVLFQCSANDCQTIFSKTIVMLSKTLRVFIMWPSKIKNSRNLPQYFKGYEDVRVVLDCTEIHVQHTQCLDCKGGLTAKFMTGVSPSGSIIYVSKMYDEKTSDTGIFNQSGLPQLLKRGDAVMVDEGFQIEGTCEKYGWKLHRSSYLTDKQLNTVDSDHSYDVSTARVHIKKHSQRLKAFLILQSPIACELHSLLEDAFIVICSIINLCSPIIADSNLKKDDVQSV